MYSLVKALWALYFEKPTLKVLIIGMNESGKSCLLTRLKMNANQKAIEFSKIIPTVGLNIAKIEYKKFNTLIWDLGGAPLLRSIWKKYYPDCHGIVFLVDQDYLERKDELIKTFENIVSSPDNKGVPILVLINKIEIMENQSRPIKDEISSVLSIGLIHDRKIIVETCSALNGTNVESSMNLLFESILRLSTQK